MKKLFLILKKLTYRFFLSQILFWFFHLNFYLSEDCEIFENFTSFHKQSNLIHYLTTLFVKQVNFELILRFGNTQAKEKKLQRNKLDFRPNKYKFFMSQFCFQKELSLLKLLKFIESPSTTPAKFQRTFKIWELNVKNSFDWKKSKMCNLA